MAAVAEPIEQASSIDPPDVDATERAPGRLTTASSSLNVCDLLRMRVPRQLVRQRREGVRFLNDYQSRAP